jgi:hypothetical protein
MASGEPGSAGRDEWQLDRDKEQQTVDRRRRNAVSRVSEDSTTCAEWVGYGSKAVPEGVGWELTTPHKLQGRGEVGKPGPSTVRLGVDRRKATAAPCQLHAVVRRRRAKLMSSPPRP